MCLSSTEPAEHGKYGGHTGALRGSPVEGHCASVATLRGCFL